MVVGILAAIGVVIHGIGVVLGRTWDVSKQFVSWLFGVMPRPLKFFFFLYMVLFLVTLIMPKFLGAGFACADTGEVYKINMFELWSAQKYVDDVAMSCNVDVEAATDIKWTDVAGLLKWFKGYLLTVRKTARVYYGIRTGNLTMIEEEERFCEEYRRHISSNQTTSRDFVLQQFGEPLSQKDYRQVVHIGCARDNDGEWYQTLKFFNIDLFNFEMWLMIGIMVMLVPFAFKWYHWVHKK